MNNSASKPLKNTKKTLRPRIINSPKIQKGLSIKKEVRSQKVKMENR
jgi:hypothetical protein